MHRNSAHLLLYCHSVCLIGVGYVEVGVRKHYMGMIQLLRDARIIRVRQSLTQLVGWGDDRGLDNIRALQRVNLPTWFKMLILRAILRFSVIYKCEFFTLDIPLLAGRCPNFATNHPYECHQKLGTAPEYKRHLFFPCCQYDIYFLR